MRRAYLLIIGLPLVLGLGLLPASALTVGSLQKLLAAGAQITVVDVRSPSAFAAEHIPGAINIPAPACPVKKVPPLGRIIVCGDGLAGDADEAAAKALAAKPGLEVEILAGGYAAWKSGSGFTTRGAGFKREDFNYISYAQLKASKKSLVLYDLRHTPLPGAPALTDLKTEFPGLQQVRSSADAVKAVSTAPSLMVLVDDGNGVAEQTARMLKLGGNHNYVILAGGELILSRHGQAGLQRKPSANPSITKIASGGGK